MGSTALESPPVFVFLNSVLSNFFHINVIHLLSNLVCVGLTSMYERRVGALRFLTVLLVSCVFASFSCWIQKDVVSLGLSGGVFGLAGAFFVDHQKIGFGDWLIAVAVFGALSGLFVIQSTFVQTPNNPLAADHWAHGLGAVGGILFCTVFPNKKEAIP